MLSLVAQVVLVSSPSPCTVPGGAPDVVAYDSRAVVGDEWVCTWTTRPPGSPWTYPNVPSVLAIGLNPIAPVQIPGGGGCWLMTTFDAWIIPNQGPQVSQGNGVIRTRVPWPGGSLGWTFYVQLLAADDRTPIGVVTSPLMIVSPESN